MTSIDRNTQPRVLHLEEIDSTNAEAMRLAGKGERGPLWIIADRQTAARGRSGRSWTSADGNLAVSYLFEPGCQRQDLHQLALLTGVAVHAAVNRAAVPPIDGLRLKWPNDLLVGAAKAGGILVETTSQGGRSTAVIGVGLNIASAPDLGGRSVTALIAHSPGLQRELMFDAIRAEIGNWLAIWRAGAGFRDIRSAWLERAGQIGERLAVNGGSGPIEGNYIGIDEDGALLLRNSDGLVRRLTYGDVSLAT
jgi:BirA family transcriptional regulator, biotin operon repressor / biotin---[acetyl-CoA-carboxylase] ligase